jgi:hypothetical protein
MQHQSRARSFEQDLLWSILDQDAVPQILEMARRNWNIDAATAWNALQQQAAEGRLRAYRGLKSFQPVDLTLVSLNDASQDFELFVEPTDLVRNDISEAEAGTKA